MKTCYIAIGGITCKALKDFSLHNSSNSCKYLYFDTDPSNDPFFDDSDLRIFFDDYSYKSGYLRMFGKDMFKSYLYTGKIPSMIDDFFRDDDIELRLLTTSFGGFGSAIVFELADYLSAQVIRTCGKHHHVDVNIIAFSRKQFDLIFTDDDPNKNAHEMNEVDFVKEYRSLSAKTSRFFPKVNLILFYSPLVRKNSLENVFDLPITALKPFDIKDRYRIITPRKEKDVFISYSTTDQKLADKVVDSLLADGIHAWIATRNIGPGDYAEQIVNAISSAKIFAILVSQSSVNSNYVKAEINSAFQHLGNNYVMIPFVIEDVIMNPALNFYLGCTEQFHLQGQPTMEAQIQTIISIIKDKLELLE